MAVDHAAIDFELAQDPDHRDLAVRQGPRHGEDYSAYYRIPRSTEDLLARSQADRDVHRRSAARWSR